MKNAKKKLLEKLQQILRTNLYLYLTFFCFFSLTTISEAKLRNETTLEYCPQINKNFFLKKKITHKDINNFSIEIKNQRKFETNILLAKQFTKNKKNFFSVNNDLEILKKKFNAKIKIYFKNGLYCLFEGTVRLHGGYLADHINGQDISLRVDLKNSHILNSTKFSLILFSNRKFYNELFVSDFLRYLDFIVPLNFLTKVSLNGNNQYQVIFQDKDIVNILNYNKRKNGPIFADNKRSHDKRRPLFRVKLEKNLINQNRYSLEEILSSLDKLNYLYLDNFSRDSIDKLFLKDFNNFKKISLFYSLLVGLDSIHGLGPGDKRFYYDEDLNLFEPILYNPESRILENLDQKNKFKLLNLYEGEIFLVKDNLEYAIEIVKEIDPIKFYQINELNRYNLLPDDISNVINKVIRNLKQLKNTSFPVIEPIDTYSIFRENNNNYKLAFHEINNIFLICDYTLNLCQKRKLSDNQINRLISNQISNINNSKLRFIRKNKNNYKNGLINIKNNNFIGIKIPNLKLNIFANSRVDVSYDPKENIINLKGYNDNTKIIFYDNIIKNYKIKATRVCLEFNKTKLEKTSITLNNNEMSCSDNLHFMNSNGNLNNIEINDVKVGDSLDADFSNIKINYLLVNSSGGECIGVKSGSFKIIKSNLFNCGDRAVSSGENGDIEIDYLNIDNAKYALQAKDSAKLSVKDLKAKKIDYCLVALRTRYDYFGGLIYLDRDKYKCVGKYKDFIDKHSNVSFL